MFANVGRWNTRHQHLAELVNEVNPDIIALAEVDDAWMASLGGLRASHPFRAVAARDDNYGIALLSRFPLSETSSEALGPLEELPSIRATVETDAGPWRVIVTHPVPPFHAAAFGSRNGQIAAIAAEIEPDGTPTLVLADLNATPWSPVVRGLRREAGLRSAASGLRARYTWPTGFPFLALELDYCLYSAPAVPLGYEVLPNVRSDHFPILCEFARAP